MAKKSLDYEFYNEVYEEKYAEVEKMSDEEKNALIERYPKSKNMFVALLLLVTAEKEDGECVDDWECDLANVVWKEVQG